MTTLASVLQPAIDELEKDLAELERKANGLLTSINVLRAKAGLPPAKDRAARRTAIEILMTDSSCDVIALFTQSIWPSNACFTIRQEPDPLLRHACDVLMRPLRDRDLRLLDDARETRTAG